ncbi:MAG TPA: hypothetical protein VMH30_07085 [Verrucomicrobiae bacterium]|nr:hypothetical protein [Verrucomicrobiae bacterium]
MDKAALCEPCQLDHAHGLTVGLPIQNSAGVEFKFPAQFLWHNRLAFGCNSARHSKNFQLLMSFFKRKMKGSNFHKVNVRKETTQAEQLFACLKAGTVSTNVHLRKLHNFCLSMNWLPWPLIPRRLWPEVKFQPKRAITLAEHQLIVEREKNPERPQLLPTVLALGRFTEQRRSPQGRGQ